MVIDSHSAPNCVRAWNTMAHAYEILQVLLAISGGTLVPLVVERVSPPTRTPSPPPSHRPLPTRFLKKLFRPV